MYVLRIGHWACRLLSSFFWILQEVTVKSHPKKLMNTGILKVQEGVSWEADVPAEVTKGMPA